MNNENSIIDDTQLEAKLIELLREATTVTLARKNNQPLTLSRQTQSNLLQSSLRECVESRRDSNMLRIAYYQNSEFWILHGENIPLYIMLGTTNFREYILRKERGTQFPSTSLTPSLFGQEHPTSQFLALLVDPDGSISQPRAWLLKCDGIGEEDNRTLSVVAARDLFGDTTTDSRVVIDL